MDLDSLSLKTILDNRPDFGTVLLISGIPFSGSILKDIKDFRGLHKKRLERLSGMLGTIESDKDDGSLHITTKFLRHFYSFGRYFQWRSACSLGKDNRS